MRQDIRLAADIGGTFTDIALDIRGERHTTKILTSTAAPEEALLAGAKSVLDSVGLTFAELDQIIHGTTLATNAIIERKGAQTALIASDGFRDTLEIADESRFDQYDVMIQKPSPLVPRELRFTVPERLDVTGKVQRGARRGSGSRGRTGDQGRRRRGRRRGVHARLRVSPARAARQGNSQRDPAGCGDHAVERSVSGSARI